MINENTAGNIGIGTTTPSSKLTVAGLIQSMSGGFKFPDGTVQLTAGVTPGNVVTSLNGLKDNVTLAPGPNITITPSGNSLTIAATNAGLTAVAHDGTLTGNGTNASPLSVAPQEGASLQIFTVDAFCDLHERDTSTGCTLATVPAGKRLVIEYVSAIASLNAGEFIAWTDVGSQGPLKGSVCHHFFPATLGSDGAKVYFGFSQQTKLYVNAGNVVTAQWSRVGTGPGSMEVIVSGYFVDVP
jgi:hypothetical protein